MLSSQNSRQTLFPFQVLYEKEGVYIQVNVNSNTSDRDAHIPGKVYLIKKVRVQNYTSTGFVQSLKFDPFIFKALKSLKFDNFFEKVLKRS
jgi:hypothetical protein